MKSNLLFCAALAAALYFTPAYAADYSAQVVSFSKNEPDEFSIELTGSKVITDDFSFKIPSSMYSKLVMVQNENSYDIYEKKAYQDDKDGLIFSILTYEDTHYRDLNGCTILGFSGNKLFILDTHYDELYTTDSDEYTKCQELVTSLKRSFVSYIKDTDDIQ